LSTAQIALAIEIWPEAGWRRASAGAPLAPAAVRFANGPARSGRPLASTVTRLADRGPGMLAACAPATANAAFGCTGPPPSRVAPCPPPIRRPGSHRNRGADIDARPDCRCRRHDEALDARERIPRLANPAVSLLATGRGDGDHRIGDAAPAYSWDPNIFGPWPQAHRRSRPPAPGAADVAFPLAPSPRSSAQRRRCATSRTISRARPVPTSSHRPRGGGTSVHVRQLRQKIEPDSQQPSHIRTETGVGYRLEPAPDDLEPSSRHAAGGRSSRLVTGGALDDDRS
jgi:hypothetical protein